MSCQDGVLGEAVSEAQANLQELLNQARGRLQELGASRFVNEGVVMLYGGIDIYEHLFTRTGFKDRQALETAVGKSSQAVRDAANQLLDLEDDWNEFLSEVEINENGNVMDLVSVGGQLSGDLKLHRVSQSMCQPLSLEDFLATTSHTHILLVLNRHFA